MKLYVGNLSYESTEDDLRDAFSNHGEVASVNVITDRDTGRPKGFAFVEMTDSEEAQTAMRSLNGTDLGGRQIKVDEARPRRENDQRRGGGGGHRDRW
jgi:cold-inducible RNA-binding protein